MTVGDPNIRRQELATRIVVGFALVGFALFVLWLGGIAFWLVVTIIGIGMLREWADLAKADLATRRMMLFALSVPLAIMSPMAAGPQFFALGLIAAAAVFILVSTRQSMLALGIIYTGLPVLALLLIRKQPDGLLFTIWAMALVWMCDIGAFFVGRAFGGPRLAPSISPNKTWAGFVGGIVAAAAFGAILHVGWGLPWRLTLATPLLAVAAQGGDLYESWLKRQAGVKDSGSMLPGHGGLMDRLDGLIPVAPIAAFLVMLPEIKAMVTGLIPGLIQGLGE
ncbi:phosphatidate cytidylyltransferase [Sphingomonas sp. 28-62-11]|uniref:phosphatidate cytidylyltransferase n=1 Tax=Sphingomonas sp. 28-62-11 TaxID=1970432 RepID=UPI000BD2FF09|nr:MAG: phosphatidate cytidylyltransferase [Sphingomonas sp. 28-62-11]